MGIDLSSLLHLRLIHLRFASAASRLGRLPTVRLVALCDLVTLTDGLHEQRGGVPVGHTRRK